MVIHSSLPWCGRDEGGVKKLWSRWGGYAERMRRPAVYSARV